jgi:hypothetical protein
MIAPNNDPDLPADLVSDMLNHSLRALPEEDRPDAKRRLLQILADAHQKYGAEFPPWLTILLAEE